MIPTSRYGRCQRAQEARLLDACSSTRVNAQLCVPVRMGSSRSAPPKVKPPLDLVLQERVARQPGLLWTDQTPQIDPMINGRAIPPNFATVAARRVTQRLIDLGMNSLESDTALAI